MAASNLHTSVYQLRKLLKINGLKDPIQFSQLLERENHDEWSIQQLLNCYEGEFLKDEEYPWAF
ncbi:hypothetical protein [Lysinibacillus fusiformis]